MERAADEMRPRYEPRPEIARMKSFDGAHGFRCHQIKWTIGKLPVSTGDNRCMCSEYFKTTGANYYFDSISAGAKWFLRLFIHPGDNATAGLNIMRTDDSDGEDDESPEDDEIPVIIRVKFINLTKGVSEFSSSATFHLADTDFTYDWNFSDEYAKKLSTADHYVVYFWLDIPKEYNGRRTKFGQNSGSALLSSSLAYSFKTKVIKGERGDPTSDIELVVKINNDEEEGRQDEEPPRFYCHRFILAARSPVFEMMFTDDRFKENHERIVEIEDTDVETLKLVLEYIYTGEIIKKFRENKPSKQSIISLLNAAEKYMLPELKDECILALIGGSVEETTVSDDNDWIEYLQLAETFHLSYLTKICILALSTNLRSLKDRNIRDNVSPSAMEDLLELATKRGEITKQIIMKTSV